MSFVVPGITHCEKHMNPIGLGQICEDCEKEMENMLQKAREYAKKLEKKKMTNREWLLNKMQNMSDEELADIVRCGALYTIYAMKCLGEDCLDCKINWLKSEHKEKITLSEAERIILENIDKDYCYIARNENGNLEVFLGKPRKESAIWHSRGFKYFHITCFNHLFQFITWEDSEPYNIEELLKCGD